MLRALNHFPIHYTLNRELTEFYVSVAINNFAIGLISIFEPIYIFLFFRDTLSFGHALSFALFYFAVNAVLQGLLYPFGAKLLSHIGVKHSILLSVPILFLYFVGLWQIDFLGLFVFALPLLRALQGSFFWPAFHLDFTEFTRRGDRGRQLSYFHVIVSVISAAAPFIGGFVIAELGFPSLFLAVLLLLFVSVVPLFLSPELYNRFPYSWKDAFKSIARAGDKARMVSFAFSAIEGVPAAYIWPLFLFLLAISFESLGLITTATMGLGVLFVIYLGRVIDRRGAEKVLRIGVLLSFITWPLRAFVGGILNAFLVQTLNGFMRSTAQFPFGVLYYDWVGESPRERVAKITSRGIAVNVGEGIGLIAFGVLFLFISDLRVAFFIAPFLILPLLLFFWKRKRA